MSQELDAPKMPAGTYPELSPNPNSEGLKLKDGGRGTPVVVNTEPRKANTNTITVNEVKRLIREAIDHFEKEEGGVTEAEMESYVANAIATKADKVGELPYFEVNSNDLILPFAEAHNDEPLIIYVKNEITLYFGKIRVYGTTNKSFHYELEVIGSRARYVYNGLASNKPKFSSISTGSASEHLEKDWYTIQQDTPQIHEFTEGTVLSDIIWFDLKTGDILKVNNMQFIINVFETTGEGAYKGVTGKMLGAVTSNSISIISLDWRTVGEGYTALEPTLTTLTIPSAE